MSMLSKRQRLIKQTCGEKKEYSIKEAVELLKSFPLLKFDESVETTVHLSIDPKKSDQVVRGAVVLPHGIGRKARVIVVSQDKAQREVAIEKGAYRAGFEDIVHAIKENELALEERDVIIATPAAMKLLMPLGSVLGPKGLMPNPKLGTVTDDIDKAVQEALAGRVRYRNDKGGIVRCLIGKLSFSAETLQDNLQVLVENLLKNRPDAAPKSKTFIKKVTLSSTMGPELWIDKSGLDLNAIL